MTFMSGFTLVGAAYRECMAVFALDDRRLGFPVTNYLYILPMRRAKLPCLLLQGKLLVGPHLPCKPFVQEYTCTSDVDQPLLNKLPCICKPTVQMQQRRGLLPKVL